MLGPAAFTDGIHDGITMPEPTPRAPRPRAGGEFEVLHELVRKARQNLNQNNWDYIVGGNRDRDDRAAQPPGARLPGVARARAARCEPRRRVDHRLGRKLRLPVLLAPVGSIESFDPGGGATIVRAAGEFGVAHMLSSVCKPHLEGVADAAPDATRIYQLYVRSDAAATDAVVRRVIDRGYRAFCMTVDSAVYSRRERDLAKRHRTAGRLAVEGRNFRRRSPGTPSSACSDSFDIPIVLKGIPPRRTRCSPSSTASNGSTCRTTAGGSSTTAGLDGGAAVDRRGGEGARQDHRRRRLLPRHRHRQGHRRRRRPRRPRPHAVLCVAAAGQAGVVRMLELLEDEVQRCLMLVGAAKLADLGPLVPGADAAGQPAPRTERVPAAGDRAVSVLARSGPRCIRRGGPSARPRGRSPRVVPAVRSPAFGRPGGPSRVDRAAITPPALRSRPCRSSTQLPCRSCAIGR
jgi:glycolate oxidase